MGDRVVCMMCMMSEGVMRSESLIMSRDLKVLTNKNAAKLKWLTQIITLLAVISESLIISEILLRSRDMNV